MEREPEKYNGPRKYKPKRPFLGRNLSGQMPFLSVLLGREKVLDRLENEECSQWNINRRSETPQATLSAYYRSPEMERKICVSFEKLHVYEVKNIIFKILLLVWMQLYCQYHLRIKHNLLEEFIREQMHPIVFFSTWDFFNKKNSIGQYRHDLCAKMQRALSTDIHEVNKIWLYNIPITHVYWLI